MSAAIRQTLAAAASTVDGCTGHPYYVQQLEPGTVLIRLERIEYPNPFGGIGRYNAVLVLPQDTADAEQYLEAKLDDLVGALEEHLVIDSVVPQRMDLPGVGILPVAFINGHREEE